MLVASLETRLLYAAHQAQAGCASYGDERG